MKDHDHGTHGTPGPATDDNSVTTDQPGHPDKVGQTGTHKAKNKDGPSSPSDHTGIDPQGPIDPKSPDLIPS